MNYSEFYEEYKKLRKLVDDKYRYVDGEEALIEMIAFYDDCVTIYADSKEYVINPHLLYEDGEEKFKCVLCGEEYDSQDEADCCYYDCYAETNEEEVDE